MSVYNAANSAGYQVSATGYTSRGGREHNEDSGAFLKAGSIYYMLLADGLGGHGGGDLASYAAVDGLKKHFREYAGEKLPSVDDLSGWCMEINDYILSLQTPDSPMRTTISTACIDLNNGDILFSHSGDTRIYYFIDGKLEFMSFDHSISGRAFLAGEITLDGIRFHKDRNKLLRVLGGEKVEPPEHDIFKVEPGKNIAILVCSDGFWEYVKEDEMESTLFEAKDVDGWLRSMRTILEGRVKGENDNNSALVFWAEYTGDNEI